MSIVRDNLMIQENYTPYCGSVDCRYGMPRTVFNGKQFQCRSGWQSSFDNSFILNYKSWWGLK